MARRRDDPRDQRAKGYPGRRKSKTHAAIEKMERQAARDAKLFAEASDGRDLQALPIFLADPRLAAAQQIWRDYAPRLDKLHLLSVLDRLAFAGYCIYSAEFVLANRDVMDRGAELEVPTIAKGKGGKSGTMLRKNPAVDRRDFAFDQMLKLGEKFGLTPLDRHNLIAKHVMRDDDQTLFGRTRIPQTMPSPESDEKAPAPAAADPEDDAFGIGGLNQFDTPPPGKLQ